MATVVFDEDGVTVTRDGPIVTLTMARGENRVNPEMNQLLNAALDKIEAMESPKAVIFTSSDPKFFGNGLDLAFMKKAGPKGTNDMMLGFWKILARVLVMNCHTVAAINGHAFGAGLFLAMACDWRVMNSEKGFCNFPELSLGMRLSKPFAELTKCKLSANNLRTGVLMGARISSSDGIKMGIIDVECPMDKLLEEAKKVAASTLPNNLKLKMFNSDNFTGMKKELYTDAYRALTMASGYDVPESRL